MAVTTDGYFSNVIVKPIGGAFDIYQMDNLPRVAIGTRLVRQDGNEFAYCHFGADTTQGLLVATDVSESGVAETDNIVIAPASAANTSDGTIGSKFVQITLASVTADQFAGGYLNITDGTGLGYVYRIKGNNATDVPASGDFRIQLHEPLQVALDTTSDIAITGSLYANLEVATSATDTVLAGVTCSNMDVSVASFGWICVKGVWTVNVDATDITIGDILVLSGDVSGAVHTFGDAVTTGIAYDEEEIVGTALDAPDDNSFVLVKLKVS